ncbi:MAG TPA: RNA polymerase sigma factor SigM [Acidothermaceae bacterium]|nr:RNA polymerase sigma factor SigM [Acidothermaceae bacterium]
MTGAPDDAELLRRHLNGDPDAFAELVRGHRDHLWAVALRTLGNPDDAADAVQDALISAMRHAGSFRGDAQVGTWLHRIVVNACLDRLRRRAAHPTTSLPDDEHAGGMAIPPSSRDEYDERDTAADVHAALATLSADQRAAIVLVDIEGYPVDQVAAILEVPTGTVKSRCARGRAKLVPLLAHLRGAESGNPPPSGGVQPPTTAPREDLR